MGTAFPKKPHFGNYEVVRHLGRGGFADVYLGQHVHMGRLVAIKVLRDTLDGPGERDRFLREAQRIAALRHSNIVHLLDYGLQPQESFLPQPDIPYLVMEYAPNGTFADAFAGKPLDPIALVPYVKQIASALQYAHDQGLIHRDIKPENILLGQYYEALLSDFGIAVGARSTQQENPTSITMSYRYTAPEQLMGSSQKASDQYALATCLYEWMSGNLPFVADNDKLLAWQKLNLAPRPLRIWVPTISPGVETVILKALATDYQARYPSVSDFLLAYEESCRTGSAPSGNTTRPSSAAPIKPSSGPQPPPAPSGYTTKPPSGAPIEAPFMPTQPPPAPIGVQFAPTQPPLAPSPGNTTMPTSAAPVVPPPPPPVVPPPPAPRPRRARVLAISSALLFALVVIAGSVALFLNGKLGPGTANSPTVTRQPSPTLTATLSPDFKRYLNKDGTFEVTYPSTWKVGPPTVANGTGADIDGPGNLVFTVGNQGVTHLSPGESVDGFCHGFFGFDGKPVTTTINGHSWTMERCNSIASPLTAIAEAIIYKGDTYFMAYKSDTSTFDTDRNKYFTAIAQSFMFLV